MNEIEFDPHMWVQRKETVMEYYNNHDIGNKYAAIFCNSKCMKAFRCIFANQSPDHSQNRHILANSVKLKA